MGITRKDNIKMRNLKVISLLEGKPSECNKTTCEKFQNVKLSSIFVNAKICQMLCV